MGIGFGAAMAYLGNTPRVPESTDQPGNAALTIARDIASKCGLDEQQTSKVKEIMLARLEALQKIRNDAMDQVVLVHGGLRDDMRGVMSDDQFGRWKHRFEEARRRARFHHRPGGRPSMHGGHRGYTGWGSLWHGKGFYRQPDLGLTDEQKKQIETIRKEALKQSRSAPPEQWRTIFEQMRKDMEKVFTPEQLEKLKKSRKYGPMPGRRFGPTRPGRGGKGWNHGSPDNKRRKPDDSSVGML